MSSSDTPFGDAGPVTYNPGAQVSPARRTAEAQIMGMAGVRGVGEGRDATGNPAWIAYVDDHSVAALLPKNIDGRPVIAEITGIIDAQLR